MTAVAVLACYAAPWPLVARCLYGRWRGTGPARRYCAAHGSSRYRACDTGCCMDAAPLADGTAAALAMLAALAWPVVAVTALTRFRPPPTASERAERDRLAREERARLAAREAELERELRIGGEDR